MGRDPLSAAPRYLVQESVDIAARLELDQAAWPWLAEAGLDVAATLSLLRAQARATEEALIGTAAAKDEAGVPSILAAQVLQDVQAWQRRIRHALHRAPEDPAGRAAVRELRGALGDGRRVAAAIAETATVPARLRELAPALGEVPAADLAGEGEALHGRLVTVRQEADRAAGVRGQQVRVVAEQVAALRVTLRELRRAFQYASEVSEGRITPLTLALLRSVVAADDPKDGVPSDSDPASDERNPDRVENKGASHENKGASDGDECASHENNGASDGYDGASDENEGASTSVTP